MYVGDWDREPNGDDECLHCWDFAVHRGITMLGRLCAVEEESNAVRESGSV